MMVSCNNQTFPVSVHISSLLPLPQKLFQNLLQQKSPDAECSSPSLAKLETSASLQRESGPAAPPDTCHKLHPLPVVLKLLWFRCRYYLSYQKEVINLISDATEWYICDSRLDQCRKYPELIHGVEIKIWANLCMRSLTCTCDIHLQCAFSVKLKLSIC